MFTGTLGTGRVGFPGLGIYEFDLNRTAFKIFGLEIYWYGILIGLGFITAVIVALRLVKKTSLTEDNLIDAVLWSTPVAIIFARLFYVVMSSGEFSSFYDVVNIRKGGLAIYGGLIGAILAAAVFCRIKKINLAELLDIVGPAFLIGQAIGRWGNFVNQEAFGGLTDLPWRMRIYIGTTPFEVHPTFLYESLWNLIGFIILLSLFKKRKYNGHSFLRYVAWYGFGRMLIETLRTDSLLIPGTDIAVSELIGLLSFLTAVAIMIVMSIKIKRRAESVVYSPQFEGVKQDAAPADEQELSDDAAPLAEEAGGNSAVSTQADSENSENSENEKKDGE